MTTPAGPVDVLLVEDDSDMRAMMSEVLQGDGYLVAGVGDGAAAVDYLTTSPSPRLILLDDTMPVMNGEEFRAIQKGVPAWNAIPTLSMTAAGAATRLATYGALPFLAKPFKVVELLDVVRKYLR